MFYDVLLPNQLDQDDEAATTSPFSPGQAIIRLHRQPGPLIVASPQNHYESFADRCRRAVRDQQRATAETPLIMIGYWDEAEGTVRLMPGRERLLACWIGTTVSRQQLEACDSRMNTQAAARQDFRRALIQGNSARAAAIRHQHGIRHW